MESGLSIFVNVSTGSIGVPLTGLLEDLYLLAQRLNVNIQTEVAGDKIQVYVGSARAFVQTPNKLSVPLRIFVRREEGVWKQAC